METIHQYIENQMNDVIVKKKQNPIPSLLVLAVGIVLLIMMRTLQASDSLRMIMLTVGIICTALGFILTAMNLSGSMWHFFYKPTSCRMKDTKIYLSASDYRTALDAMGSNDSLTISSLKPQVSGNGALDLLFSTDGACLLLLAGHYEGSRFESETPVACFHGADALSIMKLCKSN